jgi:hypothetical protein
VHLQAPLLRTCFVKGCTAKFHVQCAAKGAFVSNLDFLIDEGVRVDGAMLAVQGHAVCFGSRKFCWRSHFIHAC